MGVYLRQEKYQSNGIAIIVKVISKGEIVMFWFIVFVITLFVYPPLAIIILLIGAAYAIFAKKK